MLYDSIILGRSGRAARYHSFPGPSIEVKGKDESRRFTGRRAIASRDLPNRARATPQEPRLAAFWKDDMVISTDGLATHVAKCAARLNAIGVDASGDTFLVTSYLAEAVIKTVGIVLQVGLRERAPSHAYRIAYELVRADGLGTWEAAIRECTSDPLLAFAAHECGELVAWLTKRRSKPDDEWYKRAKSGAEAVLRELGTIEDSASRRQTVRDLIANLVQIRNKTKAHGAVGPDFFAQVNEPYANAVTELVSNCPALKWQWMHLVARDKGNVRCILLNGEGPRHLREADATRYHPTKPGVHFLPSGKLKFFYCADLLRGNREYSKFLLPNGGYDGKGRAEFLDYATGKVSKEDIGMFVAPPVMPPASETQGAEDLDVQGNVFANLPPLPRGYIERPRLERELHGKLLDRNHAIVTLHGRGGVGKTMLALSAAHHIAQSSTPRYEAILWFSARDVDLRPGGPTFVRPAVVNLNDISEAFSRLVGSPDGVDYLARALEGTSGGAGATLFIFDNFETLSGIADLHQFLDAHTHLPNKTLITSRERAFKADYPIEVKGMEYDEAQRMLRSLARELNVEGVATDDVIRSIFDNTEGHAYLMRVVMGEVAKEGRYVPPKQLVSRRLDIVDAVFERSFDKLSDSGRHVFLIVANWKSAIPAIALVVVLTELDLDAESGIEECLRLSLINRDFLRDGHPCYTAPLLARLFGQKKLLGDPDRLVIQGELETVRRFGVVDVHAPYKRDQDDVTGQFVAWCCDPQASAAVDPERLDRVLQSLAEAWPNGWLALARFRQACNAPRQQIEYALRRAVEEVPQNKPAWLARAAYAESVGDEATRVSSLISAVEADPADVDLLLDVAGDVTRYVSEHASEIPRTRRGVYLASVREHLERVSDQLSADGLSRLSWLYLLEQNEEQARRHADAGLKQDPSNPHCSNILQRLAT